MKRQNSLLLFFFLTTFAFFFIGNTQDLLAAQEKAGNTSPPPAQVKTTSAIINNLNNDSPQKTPQETLTLLSSLMEQMQRLNTAAETAAKDLMQKGGDNQNADQTQLKTINQQLTETSADFERTATGVDPSLFGSPQNEVFSWKDQLTSLLQPIFKGLNDLTSQTRKKAELKETALSLQKQANATTQAITNLRVLISQSKDRELSKSLKELLDTWTKEQQRISDKIELNQLELNSLSANRDSFFNTINKHVFDFFKTRGLYLTLALLAFVGVFLILRYLFKIVLRNLPKNSHGRQSMSSRIVAAFSHFISLTFAVIALVAVIYATGDWLLFSIIILLLLGLLWTARQTLPSQWKQTILILNLGAVREGERLTMDGVPWRVDSLSIFCRISNPDLGLSLRVPISVMLDKISRPYNLEEPWFPCKKGDWIKLSDDSIAQVTSVSHEQVAINRYSLDIVYQTSDFLAMAVANMSQAFFVRIAFGLSYDLQATITTSIPPIFRSFIQKRLDDEGYSSKCLSLSVEFKQASSSTLDLGVYLEFSGDQAHLRHRLERSLQRWCVDCCTANNWEIPFNQLTLNFNKQNES